MIILNEYQLTRDPALSAEAKSMTPNTGCFKDRRVLLVEDAPDNQLLICAFLRETGAEITVAQNGKEGVDRAQASHYDIILMDIQMPLLDGHAATRQIRASGLKQPIVAMTAHVMSEEKQKCYSSGFSAYVSKPLSRRMLIETMRSVLN